MPDGLVQRQNCKDSSLAVIEACEIGDNVEIGPYALMRANIIGDDADEEHTDLSVLGPNSRTARYAMINLCVLMEDAAVNGGFQMSLYGKGCFVADAGVILSLVRRFVCWIMMVSGSIANNILGCCIGPEPPLEMLDS